MRRAAWLALLLASRAAFAFELSGAERTATFGGRLKVLTLYLAPAGPDAPAQAAVEQGLRAELKVSGEDGAFELAYALQSAVFPLQAAPSVHTALRLVDAPRQIVRTSSFALDQNLDRLMLTLAVGAATLRVGRQALGHGSARLFAASDLFAPFHPAALDREFKTGVDAVRLTAPVGEQVELEVYAVGHRRYLSQGALLGRARVSVPGVDLAAYAGVSGTSPAVAVDVSGDVGGASLYAEGFWRARQDGSEVEEPPSRIPLLRATVGAQHTLRPGLTVTAELHYSRAGALTPAGYADVRRRLDWQSGELALVGRFYAGAAVSYELGALLTANLVVIANLTDGSGLVVPELEWSFDQNTTVAAGGMVSVGAGELGSVPRMGHLQIRLYF